MGWTPWLISTIAHHKPSRVTLELRTAGWIAGLQLAARSMRHHTDRAGFVRALNGSHHYILDYLTEEVLHRQPVHNLRSCSLLCFAL